MRGKHTKQASTIELALVKNAQKNTEKKPCNTPGLMAKVSKLCRPETLVSGFENAKYWFWVYAVLF